VSLFGEINTGQGICSDGSPVKRLDSDAALEKETNGPSQIPARDLQMYSKIRSGDGRS